MFYRIVLSCAVFVLHTLSTAAENPQTLLREPPSQPHPHRIAIIGAGPGGSSASYYLNKFSQSASLPLEIAVFDSALRIGGRTTTVNALDDPRYPTELGASIFVKINHILYNATRDFGLSPQLKIYASAPDANYELGIWDGRSFVYQIATEDEGSSWRGWWDIAKLLWKYGWSPIRMQQATKNAVGEFLKFYEEPLFPFKSLQEAVEATGLDAYTGVSGRDILQEARVSEMFSREIIQASTRVNYASNLGGIHGLETLVCMAIEGAVAVKGGNWQIFDEMVKASATKLFLNTTVTDVVKHEGKGTFRLQTTNADLDEQLTPQEYDTVILAAPYQFANVTFTPPLTREPAKVPYNSLYVTLFTSPHQLSPSFFSLDSQADVPSSVITTLSRDLSEELGSRRGVDAVGPPGFWSISTLRTLHPDTDGTFSGPVSNASELTAGSADTQYLYKIFSPAPLTGKFLSSLLDFPYVPASEDDDGLSSLPKSEITWLHEKRWDSYPYEVPRKDFENFTLHMSRSSSPFAETETETHTEDPESETETETRGLYYLSVMEPFISTMETSALAGMNVARLIVDQLTADSPPPPHSSSDEL